MEFSVSILVYFASKLQNSHRGVPLQLLVFTPILVFKIVDFCLECKFLRFRWLFHLECTTRKIFLGLFIVGEVTSPGFISILCRRL